MHTGAYARHATVAAMELCVGLEEALMSNIRYRRKFVEDYMVKSPVVVEKWHPIAHARKLMLMHSFSHVPVFMDGSWMLISDLELAKYLMSDKPFSQLLASPIDDAALSGLKLVRAAVVDLKAEIIDLVGTGAGNCTPPLWLVKGEHESLCGIITPYDLM
jgi:CBS domain-containing protein